MPKTQYMINNFTGRNQLKINKFLPFLVNGKWCLTTLKMVSLLWNVVWTYLFVMACHIINIACNFWVVCSTLSQKHLVSPPIGSAGKLKTTEIWWPIWENNAIHNRFTNGRSSSLYTPHLLTITHALKENMEKEVLWYNSGATSPGYWRPSSAIVLSS